MKSDKQKRDKKKRIGDVAAEAGVNTSTLRFYERRGILKAPSRTAGYREYPPDTVQLIRFIKRCRDVGFTLDEIQDLLRLHVGGDRRRGEVRTLAEAKVNTIDQKIRRLEALRQVLETLVENCAGSPAERECLILETLDNEAPAGGRGYARSNHHQARTRHRTVH